MATATKTDKTEQFLRDTFDNFPEYACYTFRCRSYDYENFKFKFVNVEDEGPAVTVDLAAARKGFAKFKALVEGGKLDGLGLPAGWMSDAGCMDAYATDALLQCCILGEVIYG